jgi:hypothetical protein
MEDRVSKLEVSVTDIRERLAKIEFRLEDTRNEVAALKVEMHKGFAEMIKWVVGTAIVLGATGITVITFVLNYASPRALPAQPAPIVIQLPAQPAVQLPGKP